jgi:hypothetical protein
VSYLAWIAHGAIALALTVLTQVGGVIYLVALAIRSRVVFAPSRPRAALALIFAGLYLVLWFPIQAAASLNGRAGLPCTGETLRAASPLYCIAHRHYVRLELRTLALEMSQAIAERYPGTITQTLDANFPFIDGFPMLPHLSHRDGRKLDVAFYYAEDGEYQPGALRSPIGYWAFEEPSARESQPCRGREGALRWDQDWFQVFTRDDLAAEPERLHGALSWLSQQPETRRMLLEPHLTRRLRLNPSFVRFQGCSAARHDDHFHVELR